MLRAFVIWSTIAICIASPLHKYPYVFLLDVGNEELQKTNTEQLRVSIPGGALAMKYPAMGDGDPISHVRVSGIDFGTDLKVNIVGGGPGYKYVVLMFIGNPGVTYDAVVTLQTLPSDTEKSFNKKITNVAKSIKKASNKNFIAKPYEVFDSDSDDNDQDGVTDSKNLKPYSKKSKEVMQSTSTVYNYARNEMPNADEDEESDNISAEDNDDNDDGSKDEEEEENYSSSNNEEKNTSNEDSESSNEGERKASAEDEGDSQEDESGQTKLYSEQHFNQFSDIPRAEGYRYDVNINNEDNAKPDNIYDKYQDTKPRFGLGFRVYPQSFIYNNKEYQVNSDYNKDPVEFGQVVNDEDQNDFTVKDSSNDIDSDYLVAEY